MKTIYKSSVNGQFVSEAYAEANPDLTIAQEVSEIVLVRTEGYWEGLYVDGESVEQGHSIDAQSIFKACAAGPFEWEIRWVDQEWMDERGSLPPRIKDVQFRD